MAISRNQQNYIIMTTIYMELNDFNYGDKSDPRSAKEIMLSLLKEEYNETKTMELFKEEGKPRSILDILNSGAIALKQAAGFAGMCLWRIFRKKQQLCVYSLILIPA